MATLTPYYERVTGEDAPSSIGCSMESNNATSKYLITNVQSIDDLYDVITETIGDVDTAVSSNGYLSRTLPVQHPIMPFYCTGLTALAGKGGTYTVVTNPYNPFQPSIQQFALYNTYEITLQFNARPFPVYSDTLLGPPIDSSWFPPDNSGRQDFTYAREYERFVDIESKPSSDSVTVQYGQMAFNAMGLTNDSKPFTAMPKLYLNNEMLKFTWYNVPYRYISSNNSYLKRFRGTVNQNTITTSSLGTYNPGELLYLGYDPKRYTPPLGNTFVVATQGLTEFQKYCNIDMLFLYTKRTLGAEPLHFPDNQNYVPAGHNLNPFFGSGNEPLSRTFLYTSTTPTAGDSSAPSWQSAPHEILWTDPDSDNGI